MGMREKLIELQMQAKIGWTKAEFADHLIANGVTIQKWIPVTERLPDVEGTYLVFTVSGCVTTARWYPERDVRNYRGDFLYHTEGKFHRNATHWMPLPEPPKED